MIQLEIIKSKTMLYDTSRYVDKSTNSISKRKNPQMQKKKGICY